MRLRGPTILRGHPLGDVEADRRPFVSGDILENPVTGERAKLVELPWDNPERRAVGELTALVGSRVVGEHRHAALVERFTVLEGELTVRLDGVTSILEKGRTAEVRPGQWHDWWNASDTDALVRVEVTPGERFAHMIETLFGLARTGYTNDKGMPDPMQLALFGLEFSDVVEFRKPPPVIQRAMFSVVGALASAMGYQGTYPQFSRALNRPEPRA